MRIPRPIVLLVFAACLSACSSTRLVTEWKDPSITQLRFTKVLALCISKEEALRRAAEGELCAKMPSVECKPSYLVIPDSMKEKPEEAKALVQRAGFDGAVVIRVVDTREKVTYRPPSYGPSFWGYYGHAWPVAYDPGYYRSDTILRLETSIYSVTRDALLWVGTTETMNPKSLPTVVDEVVKEVRAELLSEKLIPAQ